MIAKEQDKSTASVIRSAEAGGLMIRPEFKKILLDQRGAAVILWSCFVISIPIYLMISRSVLTNPNVGTNPLIAEPARILCWLLAVVDLAYYGYWKKRYLTPDAILRESKTSKLFRALEEFSGALEERAAYVVSTYVTRKIVIYAIIEAIAVYGFVLAFLGRFVSDQYLLSALSLVLLAFEFPFEKSLAALVQAAGQPATVNTS
jgi:hypothetical protein